MQRFNKTFFLRHFLMLLFFGFFPINFLHSISPIPSWSGGGFGDEFDEEMGPAEALAEFSNMTEEEQNAVFAEVQELMKEAGVEAPDINTLRADISQVSKELKDDPEKRKLVNKSIYEDLQKNFDSDERKVKEKKAPDIIDTLTEKVEEKLSKKEDLPVSKGKKKPVLDDGVSSKTNWLEVLQYSVAPLKSVEKEMFRAGILQLLSNSKTVVSELQKLSLHSSAQNKKHIDELITNLTSFGINLAAFSRSFHLKFLFEKEQKEVRNKILISVKSFEMLREALSKNISSDVIDGDDLSQTLSSILNNKSSSKDLISPDLLTQINKSLIDIKECNEKVFGLHSGEGLTKIIDQKKKLRKAMLSVASNYKRPVGGSSRITGGYGRGGGGARYRSPSKTGYSSFGGRSGGGNNRFDNYSGMDRDGSNDQNSDNNNLSATSVLKPKNETLDSLLGSDLVKEMISIFDRLDSLNMDVIKGLSKIFVRNDLLDLKSRIDNLLSSSNSTLSTPSLTVSQNNVNNADFDENDDSDDRLLTKHKDAKSTQSSALKMSAEDVRKSLSKLPKVLFFLNKLPREVVQSAYQGLAKRETELGETAVDEEPSFITIKITTIPFFAEASSSEAVVNAFEELNKFPTPGNYQRCVRLLSQEQSKILEKKRKISELLSTYVFQPDKTEEEKWSKNIEDQWKNFEKTCTNQAIQKIDDLTRFVQGYLSADSGQIFRDESFLKKMVSYCAEVSKFFLIFPLTTNLHADASFVSSVKRFVQAISKSYADFSKAIFFTLKSFDSRNSLEFHQIISCFEEFMQNVGVSAKELNNQDDIQQILHGVVLFNKLAHSSEKDELKLRSDESWESLFTNLTFLLKFSKNKNSLKIKEFWERTPAEFKAIMPFYLHDFCKGMPSSPESFGVYERLLGLIEHSGDDFVIAVKNLHTVMQQLSVKKFQESSENIEKSIFYFGLVVLDLMSQKMEAQNEVEEHFFAEEKLSQNDFATYFEGMKLIYQYYPEVDHFGLQSLLISQFASACLQDFSGEVIQLSVPEESEEEVGASDNFSWMWANFYAKLLDERYNSIHSELQPIEQLLKMGLCNNLLFNSSGLFVSGLQSFFPWAFPEGVDVDKAPASSQQGSTSEAEPTLLDKFVSWTKKISGQSTSVIPSEYQDHLDGLGVVTRSSRDAVGDAKEQSKVIAQQEKTTALQILLAGYKALSSMQNAQLNDEQEESEQQASQPQNNKELMEERIDQCWAILQNCRNLKTICSQNDTIKEKVVQFLSSLLDDPSSARTAVEELINKMNEYKQTLLLAVQANQLQGDEESSKKEKVEEAFAPLLEYLEQLKEMLPEFSEEVANNSDKQSLFAKTPVVSLV